ncbi:MAG TPA: hypothetical protein VH350_13940 [Candidatus Sulfotelmatobacter sp.]|nr:hypothetical protein [Candidatus Sulfotelmatobacter sp.]
MTVQDDEELLIQKTDRSGFIENEAFSDLKAICYRRFGLDGKKQAGSERSETGEQQTGSASEYQGRCHQDRECSEEDRPCIS